MAAENESEVKIRVKGEGVGEAQKVASGIGGIVKNAQRAVPALLLLNQTFGQSDGIISKAIRSISGVSSALAAFGPAGGIVAAAKAGMDMVAGYFIEKAEKMLEKAKELAAKTTARLDKLKELRLTHLANDLERVTEGASKAERQFEDFAAVAAKVSGASDAEAAAREDGELAGMRHQMNMDVMAADEIDAEAVGAGWRLKIAEREAEIRDAAANREREAAEARLKTEEARLALAEKNAQKLQEAADNAASEFENAFAMASDTDPKWVARMKRLADQAAKAAANAWDEVERRRMAFDASRAEEEAAEIKRLNAQQAAYNARTEAEQARDVAERDRIQALEAAEAERDRNAGHAAAEPVEIQASAPSFAGGGDPAFGAGGEYERQAMELERRYREINLRRSLYQRSKFRQYERSLEQRSKSWGLYELDGHLDEVVGENSPWNRSWDAANRRWGGELEKLRELRRQLDEAYGNGAFGGEGNAAERTATACEGILRHFEGGRFG